MLLNIFQNPVVIDQHWWWYPSAKTPGPVRAAHAALRHSHHSTGCYYQKNHYQYKPGVADVFFIIIHGCAKLAALRWLEQFLLVNIYEITAVC